MSNTTRKTRTTRKRVTTLKASHAQKRRPAKTNSAPSPPEPLMGLPIPSPGAEISSTNTPMLPAAAQPASVPSIPIAPTQPAVRENNPSEASVQATPEEASSAKLEFVCRSRSMRTLMEHCRAYAHQSGTLLILGESGTGKERVFEELLAMSDRVGKPFEAHNCAAIPEPLLESALFGHEKGSFTGSVHRHIGAFERCNGGTLFFDEIGDMPLPIQAKLLRVFEGHPFQRLGGNEFIRTDVRIICGTNKDLRRLVRKKQFREDLYYRISAYCVELMPLRKRKKDLAALVAQLAEKGGVAVSAKARKKLLGYSWPGNIRQLINVMNRAIALSLYFNGGEKVIEKEHLRFD